MKTTKLRTDGVFVDLVMTKMGWILFVLCHLLVTSNLYFGLDKVTFGHEAYDPHKYLNIPQLAAVTSVFIYLGIFCPSAGWPMYSTTQPMTDSCHMLATIMPMTSVISSVIGIGAILSDYFYINPETLKSGDVDADEMWVIALYGLNMFFLGVLSTAMGLWSSNPIDAHSDTKKEKKTNRDHRSHGSESSQSKKKVQENKTSQLDVDQDDMDVLLAAFG